MGKIEYEWFSRRVILPLSAKWEGSKYLSYLEELEASQYQSPSIRENKQWEDLQKILHHAYSHSPHHRQRFRDAGIHPSEVKSPHDFRKIPILTREEVVAHERSLIAENYQNRLIPGLTSGSTGKPLRFFCDFEAQQFRRACIVRNNRWSGWDLGRRAFCIYGDTPLARGSLKASLWNVLIERLTKLNSLHLNAGTMDAFYRSMRKEKAPFLYGHAHNLFVFARYLKDRNRRDIRACGIISGGMNLHSWERKEIEEVFQCKVLNRYGCEELSLIASECPHQEGLHVNTDLHYVEIVKRKEEDAWGSMIVTDLRNYAMPFIRYKVGDVAAGILSGACPCGRSQPLLLGLQGRESEFILTPEGNLVSGVSLTDNFGCMIDGVKQIQIVQEEQEHLTFRIVPAERFGQDTCKAVENLSRKYFGDRMKIDFDIRGEIPMDKNGKFRFIVSMVSRDHFRL